MRLHRVHTYNFTGTYVYRYRYTHVCMGTHIHSASTGTHTCMGTNVLYTHSYVSVAKKTKNPWHTSVLFIISYWYRKVTEFSLHISKTTKPISTQFIYVLPYIYTTSHIEIERNCFSISQYICSSHFSLHFYRYI